MSASCAVMLPTRVFGGHEKMLVQWLSRARRRHDLAVELYGSGNEALARECRAAGLPPPHAVYPSRADSVRDFLVTRRVLDRLPAHMPLLFAPGIVQAMPLQWIAALGHRRQVAAYVPMAYPGGRLRLRGGRLRDALVRQLIRRVDLWLTITEAQRQLLKEVWNVRAPVLIVPNHVPFVDRARPPRETARGETLRVLFAGRFEAHQKGLDWLLERLRARAARWRGAVRFTFKGEGPYRAQLERLACEAGGAHVRVEPWGDVSQALGETDVLLLPSRCEGLPLIALEAIHHGVPVAASRDAGLCELLPADCLFAFGDEEAMWRVLERLRARSARELALAYAQEKVRGSLSAPAFDRAVAGIVEHLAPEDERWPMNGCGARLP